jgi:Tfp pilus assembly protein PilN
MGLTRQKLENLTLISQQVRHPDWNRLLAAIGTSLPQAVWLESIMLDGSGGLRMTGPSHSEDAIFEFVKNLERQSPLQNVALEGTQPAQFNNQPATRFDITCQLAEGSEYAGDEAVSRQEQSQ